MTAQAHHMISMIIVFVSSLRTALDRDVDHMPAKQRLMRPADLVIQETIVIPCESTAQFQHAWEYLQLRSAPTRRVSRQPSIFKLGQPDRARRTMKPIQPVPSNMNQLPATPLQGAGLHRNLTVCHSPQHSFGRQYACNTTKHNYHDPS
jgi:hypothetical protein